jgi:spermidine/putrescine transport system substrate-binding protein
MFDDAENNIAVALMHLGRDMNSLADDDLAAAREVLLAQKPLVQAYTSDSFKERLMAGDSWVALGWSGDLMQAQAEKPEIRVIVPSTGTMLWIDSIAIPHDARHEALAHEFIDFLLEPAIAARNAEFVKYATPVAAARSLLAKELAGDPAVYPPESTLKNCDWLQDRGSGITKLEDVWRAVK